MEILKHTTYCKKCNELVLYTWQKCPYCGCKRFVRQYNVSDIRKNLDENFEATIIIIKIILCIVLMFVLINGIKHTFDNAGGVFVSLIFGFSGFLFMLALASVLSFCLFYIIQPISHHFGKKVTISDVVNCSDTELCLTAIKHLTDQSVLTSLAKSNTNSYIRMAAAEKLTDQNVAQEVYADVAKNYSSRTSSACESAVQKTTDQNLLADIAKDTTVDKWVCLKASEKLTDQILAQEIYADIVKNSNCRYIGMEAAEKLTNIDLLVNVATNKNQWAIDVATKIVQKIINLTLSQEIYADIAKKSPNSYVCIKVSEKLIDQNLFTDIATNAKNDEIRIYAADKLTDKKLAQKVYVSVAEHAGDKYVRKAAIERLTGKEALFGIAKGSEKEYVYYWTEERTEDKRDCDRCSDLGWCHGCGGYKITFTVNLILDLRETAEKRIKELGYRQHFRQNQR